MESNIQKKTSYGHYDFVIIGGGICGCSIAYELQKYTKNILLVDRNTDVALGASGAAGAFLSPLLGKPNSFKDLVTKALKYSSGFYQENFSESIFNCGTTRIPKNQEDEEKFQSYIPFMDFEFTQDDLGYFFPVGSVVNSYGICKKMAQNIQTKFDYEVFSLEFKEGFWNINGEIKSKNVILATGYETNLCEEFYLNIRAVWGRRIDITTSTKISHNYHKECSVSKSFEHLKKFLVSIGATHHRDKKGIEDIQANTDELLQKAAEIVNLEDIEVVKSHCGARASSVDYFPMIGPMIDSKSTLEMFPYLTNGTHVEQKRFIRYENLFLINGVGGRGFVLAPYLAKKLAEFLELKTPLDESLTVDRLFKRAVRKI